ncbi:MAG: 6-carboxytetrahydropterin synthase QueD [bacterium]
MYEIAITRRFSAAHRLRNYKGKCENLHGHNYKVELAVHGKRLVNGMLIDFALLKQKLDTVIKKLDHQFINKIKPFTSTEPSAELIAEYIYNSMVDRLPKNVSISYVKVWESEDSYAMYTTSTDITA